MYEIESIKEFVDKNYMGTECTTLGEATERVFQSSQVRVRNMKPMDYYEILPQDIPLIGDSEYRKTKLQSEANPVSIENQKLQLGDVVFSSRNRLSNIEIITEELLSYGTIVVKNGSIIVRTGNVTEAVLIKAYLNRQKIKDYVDYHSKPKEKHKIRAIRSDLIASLPFPSATKESLAVFKECSEELDAPGRKAGEFSKKIQSLLELNKNSACRKDMSKRDNYNLALWEKVESKLDEMLESLKDIELSKEVEDI